MTWTTNERDGASIPQDRLTEQAQEVDYLFETVLPIYERKGYTAALWLDREIKLHAAYQRAVVDTPLGHSIPAKPFVSRLLDEAFKLPSLRAHPGAFAVFAR